MRLNYFIILLLAFVLHCCAKKIAAERTSYFPKHEEPGFPETKKENTWVFILAGQSNMAGRGWVEPGDTIPDKRIFSINKDGHLILAKEPLHFYEPNLAGLDCGLSFARTLIKKERAGINILLIPTAVGGSSISQWLGDSLHRNVKLFSNFTEKVAVAKQYGTIKAILWHQGESDANEKDLPLYETRLAALLSKFRNTVGDTVLPVIIGELGSFSGNQHYWNKLNQAIHSYATKDTNVAVISTADLHHKGDSLHFNAAGQRKIGERFAAVYYRKF